MHTEKLSDKVFMVIDKISNISSPKNMGLAIKNCDGFWMFRPLVSEFETWQLMDIAQTVGMMNQNKPL
jgi:hypothetical protein